MKTKNNSGAGNTLLAGGVTQELCDILKTEVKQVFGREIATANDCEQLASDIYNNTSLKINFNTLRRFFGLVKASHNPSLGTVAILCKYCGYSSPAEMIASKTGTTNVANSGSILLKYMLNIFKITPVVDSRNETFHALVKTIIQYLDQNSELSGMFQKAVVKTENGMSFYFEKFIHIDKLQSYYGNGIPLYINEARTPERKVVGYSLLCLKFWLAGNGPSVTEIYREIHGLNFDKKTPSVSGLFFAAAVLFANVTATKPVKVFAEAFDAHIRFKSMKTFVHDSFEIIYCRVLLLTGHFDEALYYSSYLIENYFAYGQPEGYDFYHSLLVLKAMSLSKTNKIAEARQVYNLINTSEFNFLSKESDSALYNDLEESLQNALL